MAAVVMPSSLDQELTVGAHSLMTVSMPLVASTGRWGWGWTQFATSSSAANTFTGTPAHRIQQQQQQ
jgi:hypothetical protein